MRTIIVLATIYLSAPVNAGMPGEWSINGQFDRASVAKGIQRQVELVCVLTQQEQRVIGQCRPANGPDGVPVTGSVQGKRIDWHFDIALSPKAKKQTVTFTGTINQGGTRMKGTFASADVRGQFTAKQY